MRFVLAGDTPGSEAKMEPKPDFGEERYVGHDKLKGKVDWMPLIPTSIGCESKLVPQNWSHDVTHPN